MFSRTRRIYTGRSENWIFIRGVLREGSASDIDCISVDAERNELNTLKGVDLNEINIKQLAMLRISAMM